jgi:ribosome-associated translation inhibitor RaiA
MIQKHISLPEKLDQKIRERVKRLKESEERVIQELIEEGLKSSTRDRFSVLDSIRAKNPDLDPERVEQDVTAVVEAVRQELYDKEQEATQSRR